MIAALRNSALSALVSLSLAAWCGRAEGAPVQLAAADLSQLSVEELLDVEVTLASKKPERHFEVADAIYVITGEDIRRSGVTTIPDALRLAPGVQVSRIDANKWAIGIRGFASRLARSVLVLIDGRSVYTPLFAGTYWDVQDTMIEDIDRIEVIRGAGGTVWGPNAFNGVINIITKNARDTQGGLVTFGGGNEEQGFGSARYGGQLDDDTSYRIYSKAFHRDGFAGAGKQYDDWTMGRGGFRIDRDLVGRDTFTLQGDAYYGVAGSTGSVISYTPPSPVQKYDDTELAGGNVLGRWTRTFSSSSLLTLQSYYDATYRNDLNFRETRHTFDLDLNHRWQPFAHQQVVWGLGYRLTTDATKHYSAIEFIPRTRTDHLLSWYLQDDIALLDNLHLTLGSKFEYNEYSDFEVEPSGRLMWLPAAGHALWAAISRAVRTPSRIEHDVEFTVGPTNGAFPRIVGQDSFGAEKTVSYQLGYRMNPFARVATDVVGFYQHYDDLLSLEPGSPFPETDPAPTHVVFPLLIANGLHGAVRGAEVAVDVSVMHWWRMNAFYAYLDLSLSHDPGSHDFVNEAEEDSAPHHTAGFLSKMDVPFDIELDTVFRYVDSLPTQHVGSHFNFDARIGKHVGEHLLVSLVGQNLLADQHREFGGGTLVERGLYAKVRVSW